MVPELTVGENIFIGREQRNRFGFLDYKKMYRESDHLLVKGETLQKKVVLDTLEVTKDNAEQVLKQLGGS